MSNLYESKHRCLIVGGFFGALGIVLCFFGYYMVNTNQSLVNRYGYSASGRAVDFVNQQFRREPNMSMERHSELSRDLTNSMNDQRSAESILASELWSPMMVIGVWGFGIFSLMLGIVLNVVGWVISAEKPYQKKEERVSEREYWEKEVERESERREQEYWEKIERERRKHKQQQEQYKLLVEARNRASTEKEYYELAQKFWAMKGYKDSNELANWCNNQYCELRKKEEPIRQERRKRRIQKLKSVCFAPFVVIHIIIRSIIYGILGIGGAIAYIWDIGENIYEYMINKLSGEGMFSREFAELMVGFACFICLPAVLLILLVAVMVVVTTIANSF